MTSYIVQIFIYLAAAVVMVPFVKKLGLGSVLGYLLAGVIIGPLLGLVGRETTTIQEYAEFGVVMMLFLVGLELNPKAFWKMKAKLIGLGGSQVIITTVIAMVIGLYFKLDWKIAFTIAFTLSLSSTAIVLQTFQEKKLNKTEGGKSAFSVLLFQDIAVLPMLAILPLLSVKNINNQSAQELQNHAHQKISIVSEVPHWLYALIIVGVFISVILIGHYVIRHVFAYAASARSREMFTAVALLLVIGMTALMNLIDISPAMGTFIAGVLLANSEFKVELENSIEPFKGLLLGLFFMTVGAGIDIDDFYQYFGIIVSLTILLIVVKVIVLYFISIFFKLKAKSRWLFALSLAQAGEFGFVLLSFTTKNNVIPDKYAQILNVVITLSMFLTPLLFIIFDKIIVPKYKREENTQDYDDIDITGKIIIAGAGRFGQTVNRLLLANKMNTVMIDHRLLMIERMKQVGLKTYYGDANKIELLASAGLKDAKLLILATDDKEGTVQLVKSVKRYFPHIKILARAYDLREYFKLRAVDVDVAIRETYDSALNLGAQALTHMGYHPFHAEQSKLDFDETSNEVSDIIFEEWRSKSQDSDSLNMPLTKIYLATEKALAELRQLKEGTNRPNEDSRGWNPPPKNEIDSFEHHNEKNLGK